jgi:hypothetical protein
MLLRIDAIPRMVEEARPSSEPSFLDVDISDKKADMCSVLISPIATSPKYGFRCVETIVQ